MPEHPRLKGVAKGLLKRYGDKVAVDIPEIEIRENEFLTLLGPSGCGKTTLLMMLAGFVAPDSGTIWSGGQDITRLPPEKRNFGMVFQGYVLFPHLSVADNVAYPLRRRKWAEGDIRRRVAEMIELVRLDGHASKFPRQLSGGQQQRVALARALVFEPEIVLLDEPLSALDASLRRDLQFELKRIHRKTGATFVCVTHDQDEALSMSDRIAVMRDGRIMQLDTPREIYKRPATRFVASFMGAGNILQLKVGSVDGGIASCELNGHAVLQQVATHARPGSTITIALRPANIVLDTNTHNTLPGTVTSCAYTGSDMVLALETPVGELTVRRPAEEVAERITVGSRVIAGWNISTAMIVADH